MAKPDDKPPGERKKIVRGADGALYLIDKDHKPKPVTPEQTEQVNSAIEDVQTALTAVFMPILGSGVNHEPPIVFDEDG